MEYSNKLEFTIEGKVLVENSLLKSKPYLFYEWNFEKNTKLGLDIYDVKKRSNKKAWWICLKCNSEYDMSIAHRTDDIENRNCPYCSGHRVNRTNSLATLNPELASQWHPTKNGDLTPHDVTIGSSKKVWWLGKCRHEWEAQISSRNRGVSCPYCTNQKILVGYNDLWTTHPKLASLLINIDEGYTNLRNSTKLLELKCCECGDSIGFKKLAHIFTEHLQCSKCKDGISYPEKIMYRLLNEIGIKFYHNLRFDWSNNKRYDFYIPYLNLIIETHGEQHNNGGFKSVGGRSAEEEKENDRIKKEMALNNGFNFVEIDCRISDFDYIKSSIINSELKTMLCIDTIDWDNIFLLSQKSIKLEVLEMFLKETISVTKIASKLNLHDTTVRKYLKEFTKMGLCDYADSRRFIYQVNKEGKIIQRWSGRDTLIQNYSEKVSRAYLEDSYKNGTLYLNHYWFLCYPREIDSILEKIKREES